MIQYEEKKIIQEQNQNFLKEMRRTLSIDKRALLLMESLIFYFDKHPEDTIDLTQLLHSFVTNNSHFILNKLFTSDNNTNLNSFIGEAVVTVSDMLFLLFSQELSPEKISEFLYETKLLLKHRSDFKYDSFLLSESGLFEKYYNDNFYNKEDSLIREFQDRINETGHLCSGNIILTVIRESFNLVGLEDRIKMIQCYLNNTERLRDIINQNNLRILQKSYPKSFEVFTEETRLCKSKPDSSKSPRLEEETIRLEYKHSSGRDVYSIQRKYAVPVDKAETLFDYRRARRFAEGWKFNSNTRKIISMPKIPYVTLGCISYCCSQELVRLQLKKELQKNSPQSLSPIDSFIFHYYRLLREKTYDTVLNILELNKNLNMTKPISDSLRPYIGLPLDILTPSLQKHLLTLSVSELKKDWGFLTEIRNETSRSEIKSVRKMLYSCFRKKMSPEEITNNLDMMHERQIMNEYNLSHEQLERIVKFFLPVIRRYTRGMTPDRFIKIFGKDGIHKVLGDKKEFVFTPKEYRLPSMETTALAALVNERLGCLKDKHNLSARKRLYHRLDVICPVESVLNGKISKDDIPRIKKALNLSPNKTLNLAGNFAAKIEEKCSPGFLIAGDASVCCMGLGSQKAVDYALKPGFGIFNVYFKDRIIANSLLWVNNNDTLVIDNIEVHPNYRHHDVYIREMYNQMINDMSKLYPNIVQGKCNNDLKLYSHHTPCGELNEWKPVKIDGSFYSDAESNVFLIKGTEDILTESRPWVIAEHGNLPETEAENQRNELEPAFPPF